MTYANPQLFLAALATIGLTAVTSQAALTPLTLSGNTGHDIWSSFDPTKFKGTGSFPGASAWTAPLESENVDGDAQLNRLAGGAGGGPFVATSSIYFGNFASTPNLYDGTLAVADATPVSGVKTIVLQFDLGEAFGHGLYNDALPVLSYNGGTQNLLPTYSSLDRVDTGDTFLDPVSGNNEPIYNDTYQLQWDVSSIAGINAFSVGFSGVAHAQLYDLQLDQTDTAYSTSVVPEPASLSLIALGALPLLARRRRR